MYCKVKVVRANFRKHVGAGRTPEQRHCYIKWQARSSAEAPRRVVGGPRYVWTIDQTSELPTEQTQTDVT